ncbi:tRNA (guanosine(46)-N7)-methyltransferase TrmB [Natronospira bacteriovora]|uniref:tRNA (guanine-N(7)-)-methyltransferase n=1 Tax=Natronospira bacteriovora TaxID=3069753 RepID=A0ABU0W9D5_9GAMM|nr:tRNA (guanosine(46)-N7)-methyltransferase TrmB [Natronospira sp. AB-CW4]MDQ2070611.1 tRNA (guanosine(46)-N7)-methyltransferase TrmB [Natronospira sp. AB-CW4]
MTDEKKFLRPIRSFVRREGRLTPAQERAMAELYPRYGLSFEKAPVDLAALFGREAPVTLEIGFGNGELLATLAAQHPERNFLGIEVHRPGVGRLLNRVEEEGLENVRVSTHDAVEVLREQIPENSLDRLLIFFADPWPKKRHHKRRLIQPAFAELAARRLADDGQLLLATDWEDYKNHMLEVLDACPMLENTAGPGGTVPRPDDRPVTHFERRGVRKGHGVWDLVYRKS